MANPLFSLTLNRIAEDSNRDSSALPFPPNVCPNPYSVTQSDVVSLIPRMGSSTIDGIAGCLRLGSIGIEHVAGDNGSWSFLFIICDGVASNRSAARKIMICVIPARRRRISFFASYF